MNELVSVIIPSYNAETYIEACVRSALGQTYSPLEVIVLDDGSTDGTPALLEKFADRITLVRQENRGVYATRNRGIGLAKGPYIAFLDADDFWKPEKIEKQMEVMRRHPEVSLVATRIEEVDAGGRPLDRPLKDPAAGLYGRPVDISRKLLMEGNPISLSSVLVRRELLEEARGFYADRPILSADYDLWIRTAVGRLFYLLPETLTSYRVLGHSLLHGSLEKEYQAQLGIIEMNRHRFTRREYRRRLSRLHSDWADSAFHQKDSQGWTRWRGALEYDPLNLSAWKLGARVVLKKAVLMGIGLIGWKISRGAPRPERLPRPKVFLTFDDGPHPENTEKILDVLRAHGAKGTFFMTGTEVAKYPLVARKVTADGHEVASHSWFHRKNSHLDFWGVWKEITRAEEVIESACGVPTRTFRPPYGRLTVPLLLYALVRDMRIVLWSLDSEDDRVRSARLVLENCRQAEAGDILLFHDDNRAVIEALPGVIRELRSRGLDFGLVREIYDGANGYVHAN